MRLPTVFTLLSLLSLTSAFHMELEPANNHHPIPKPAAIPFDVNDITITCDYNEFTCTLTPKPGTPLASIGAIFIGYGREKRFVSIKLMKAEEASVEGVSTRSPDLPGGVTSAISRPQGSQLLQGLSAHFYTCCGELIDDVLINEPAAVHLNLGNLAKSDGLTASYSGQFAILRGLFNQARANINSTTSTIQPLIDALNGRIKVVVDVDSVDVINSLLRLQKDFGFPLVILGGAEAFMVADKLFTQGVGVLYRSRPEPDTFERYRNSDNSVSILVAAGVKVGLTLDASEFSRNIRWEAGFAREFGLTNGTAISLITSNVADLYNLNSMGRIMVNQKANFILFNGDPLSTLTSIQLIAQGNAVECLPKQR